MLLSVNISKFSDGILTFCDATLHDKRFLYFIFYYFSLVDDQTVLLLLLALSCSPDVEEAEALLLYNLPSLCYRSPDWPALLCEATGPHLCEYKGARATQYCLLTVLHLAHHHGDR